MAELTPKERLQPALLDRLIDLEPDKKQEPRETRFITKKRLQEAVLRDLEWLFNTTRLSDHEFEGNDLARRSVINYGLPPLSGETASTLDLVNLEQSIKQVILDYEPRISPSSLRVEAIVSTPLLDQHNVISIQIRGDLWAQPVPLEIVLRTNVDLENGTVEIVDLGKTESLRAAG